MLWIGVVNVDDWRTARVAQYRTVLSWGKTPEGDLYCGTAFKELFVVVNSLSYKNAKMNFVSSAEIDWRCLLSMSRDSSSTGFHLYAYKILFRSELVHGIKGFVLGLMRCAR